MASQTSTQWPVVVDALLDLMRAAPGYRAPDGASGIVVYDGPEVGTYEEDATSYLVVGWSGDPQSVTDPGDSGQVYATFGNRARQEEGTVDCKAVAQSGDNDVAGVRSAAFAIVATVEAVLRANSTLGIPLGGSTQPSYLEATALRATPSQYATSQGVVCEVLFSVSYAARI